MTIADPAAQGNGRASLQPGPRWHARQALKPARVGPDIINASVSPRPHSTPLRVALHAQAPSCHVKAAGRMRGTRHDGHRLPEKGRCVDSHVWSASRCRVGRRRGGLRGGGGGGRERLVGGLEFYGRETRGVFFFVFFLAESAARHAGVQETGDRLPAGIPGPVITGLLTWHRWIPLQTLGLVGSMLGLAVPASVYCLL